MIPHDETASHKLHGIVTTSRDNKGDNTYGKDASHTCQNLSHSVCDQKLSNDSTGASFSRGHRRSRAHGKSKRGNKPRHVVEPHSAYNDYRDESSVHVPSNNQLSARRGDCHRVAYMDRGRGKHCSRHSQQMKPEHRGSSRGLHLIHRGRGRDCSTMTPVDVQHSSITNNSEELNISEDWETELYVTTSSEYNVNVTTDMTRTVSKTSDVDFSVASKGNEY